MNKTIAMATLWCVLPALLYCLGHILPLQPSTLFVALATGLLLTYFVGEKVGIPRNLFQINPMSLAFWIGILIFVTGFVFLQYYGGREGYYFPTVYDYPKHHGILLALQNKILPPKNPFLTLEPQSHLSYYYLSHLWAASLPRHWLSLQHRFALFSVATALFFLSGVYAYVFQVTQSKLRSATATLAVLLLGGLDLQVIAFVAPDLISKCQEPSFFSCLKNIAASYDGELPGFLQAIAWAPHHVFSSALFLWIPVWLKSYSMRSPYVLILIPLIALSVLGSSIYVGILLILPMAATLFQNKSAVLSFFRSYWGPCLDCVLFTLFLLGTFAWEIRPAAGASTSGIHLGLPTFSVHQRTDLSLFMARVLFSLLPFLLYAIVHVCKTGINPKRYKMYPWEFWSLVSILMGSFLLQSTGYANDLSIRALFNLRLMAILYLICTIHKNTLKKPAAYLLYIYILLSLISTTNQAYIYGIRRLEHQAQFEGPNLDYARATQFIKKHTDEKAIVQGAFVPFSYLMVLTDRQTLALDQTHASLLNVNLDHYIRASRMAEWLIQHLDDPQINQMAKETGVDYLIARKTSHAQRSPLHLAYQNQSYMVFQTE